MLGGTDLAEATLSVVSSLGKDNINDKKKKKK